MKAAQAAYWFISAFFMCVQCAYLEKYKESYNRDDVLEVRPCQCENGTCEFDRYRGYICKCPQEFGLYTETQCKKCDCGRAANCSFGPGNFRNMKHCLCPEGYKDLDGAGFCKGDCSYRPCKNGGTCKVVGEEIACECVPPFYGDRCTENPCDPNPCENNGVCTSEEGKANCTCEEPYIGDKCEIDPCDPNPCENNGVCTSEEGKTNCTCEEPYIGDKCEIVSCNSTADCPRFRKCTLLSSGEKLCRCIPGKTGEQCEMDVEECITGIYKNCKGNDDRCIYNDEKQIAECHCAPGRVLVKRYLWTDGSYPHYCITICDNNCANYGQCKDTKDGKFCECKRGTSGRLCETVDECERGYCGTNTTDVTCVYDVNRDGGKCVCADSTKSFYFNKGRCQVPCRGGSAPQRNCQNGGDCGGYRGGSFCECKKGTSGDLCEIVDDCTENFCGKMTDVKCVFDAAKKTGTCKCDDPSKVFDSNAKKCRGWCISDDECDSFEKCTELPSGYMSCRCLPGRSGDQCENIKDCNSGKYKSCRVNNGRCVYNKEKEMAECDCGDEKMWDDKTNRCRRNCDGDCANNGVCEGDGDVKFCKCAPGTEGDLCEMVKGCSKEENLCGLGEDVKCVYDEGKNEGKCLCDNSTKLFDFDQKECRVPCKDDCANGGECLGVGEDNKFCKCKPGTTGDLCTKTDECSKPDFCGTKEDATCVYDERSETSLCKCDNLTKRFDPIARECRVPCKYPCDNDGKCEGQEEDKFCRCKPGTRGDLCTIVDHCLGQDVCGTKRDVQCVYDKRKEAAICKCDDSRKSFDPKTKECRVPCHYKCLNNGYCDDSGDAKFCRCKEGTSGDSCAIVDDCAAGLCGEEVGVKCVYNESQKGGSCECFDTTKSFDTRTKECRTPCSGNCKNNGVCTEFEQHNFCVCKPGTSGDLCAEVDDCAKENFCGRKPGLICVYNGINGGTCKCEDSTKQFDDIQNECRIPCKDDCENNGKCSGKGEAKFCRCKPGTSGNLCTIVDHCQSQDVCGTKTDVKCVYNESKEVGLCKCDNPRKKFDSKAKECRAPCSDNCKNNGVCTDFEQHNFCVCKPGTSGDLCAEVDDCDKEDFCGRKPGLICVYNGINGGTCKCEDSTKQFDDIQNECRIPCKDDCDNNGKCSGKGEATFCRCKPGTSGNLCTIVDHCQSRDVCGTKSDVKCVYDESKEAGLCKCDNPRKRFNSKAKECRIPCHNDCLNSGVCDGDGDVKFCKCKVGTSDDLCATVDDCAIGLCGEKEGVECVYDEVRKGGSCRCHDSTKSFDSKTKECRKESICADYTCFNRGVCIEDAGGTPRCYCKAPFSGERCEKDPCSTNPCKNEGICEVKGGAYNCICKKQFWGETCEMDPCTPNPCQNGGACEVNGMMFKCTCKELFTGGTCEIDISDNRFISSAVLFLIVLLLFISMCYGCCIFRINQKLRPVCETSETCRHSCERKKRECA